MSPRDEVRFLFARQLATQQGYVWERLTAKARERLLTFAGSLLATIERKAEVSWNKETQDEND